MKPVEIILSVLITIALGLSGFTLKWMFNTNADIAVARQRMEQLLATSAQDAAQDAQLGKHWKLHGWAKGRVNELRVKQGLPLADWPPLD